MRIMALDAIHLTFKHRMVLWKIKLRLQFQVTTQASLGFLARVDNESLQPATASERDVFAAGTVARFASRLIRQAAIVHAQTRVRTRRKDARNILMAVRAGLVPHERRAFDLQRHNHRAIRSGTRFDQQSRHPRSQSQSSQPASLP
jgi:hypothetical protein